MENTVCSKTAVINPSCKRENTVAENTFVIRIWCEHSDRASVKPQFRGVIEHVISGQRQYLANSHSIIQFIQAQLHENSRNTETKSHSIHTGFTSKNE
jgi:hypothetical protein